MNTDQIEAKLIPLGQVHPDPTQPRRLLPPDLAQSLVTGVSPREVLSQLRSRAERDKWMRERLAELDALAGSIAIDGLMQPIRVIPDGDDRYRIEEGERRWWAHHILVQQGKEQFQSIAAMLVEKEGASSGLLRRRVAENVQRSGFTAIELAKAMASRIQEILTAEPGIKRSEAERRVGSENNMTDRRVRQYVALLTLSPEAQELAQQARLTESSLRPIVGIKDSARQLAAIRELMHPTPPKLKVHQPLQAGRSSKAIRKTHRRENERKPRARATNSLGILTKQSTRLPNHNKTESQQRKEGTVRKMQRLLALARSFTAKDIEQLSRTDWSHASGRKIDWRALENLHQVLERGLKKSNQSDTDGTTSGDE